MAKADFPGNSRTERTGDADAPKRVGRVTTGEAKPRKKPLGRQLVDTFVGGDPKEAAQTMIRGVLIPQAKDMVVDMITQGVERLIFGESRRRSAGTRPGGVSSYINYARMSASSQQQRPSEDRSPLPARRSRGGYEEITLPTRAEADEVLDNLKALLDQYDSATVADLYELVGMKASHTDQKWGWTDLAGSTIRRMRDNTFLLDIPHPQSLHS